MLPRLDAGQAIAHIGPKKSLRRWNSPVFDFLRIPKDPVNSIPANDISSPSSEAADRSVVGVDQYAVVTVAQLHGARSIGADEIALNQVVRSGDDDTRIVVARNDVASQRRGQTDDAVRCVCASELDAIVAVGPFRFAGYVGAYEIAGDLIMASST